MPNDVVPTGEMVRPEALPTTQPAERAPETPFGQTKELDGSRPGKEKAKKSPRVVLDLSDPETYKRLERMVRKVCPPAMEKDREDFVQVVMLRLLRRAERLGDDDPGICATYLFRAAQSVVIDEIRKRKREVLSENVEDFKTPASADNTRNEELITSNSPVGHLRSRKLSMAIDDCLAKINLDRRRAVSLRLQGFTIGEIADQLGWKKKKAENMERRGRENLRDCLTSKGYQYQC